MNEQHIAVARVYSRSLLSLAEGQGDAERILEELDGVVGLLDDQSGLEEYLANPLLDRKVRRDAIETLLRGKVSDLLADAAQVVNRKGRLSLLRAIAATYRMEYEKLRGIVEVFVTTAVPLTEELREQVVAVAERYTGRRANLVESVDPEILGGLVIQVEDHKLDRSVAGELRRVREQLLDRMSRDLHAGTSYVEEESR